MQWSKVLDAVTPHFENRFTIGNLVTLIFAAMGILAAGVAVQSDLRALAQRVDRGEVRDDKAAESLDGMRGSIIELRGDNKAIKNDLDRQGRQLDRIEQLLRGQSPPPPIPRVQ